MHSSSFIYLFIRERERERNKIFRVLCSVKWLELAPFEHIFHVQVFFFLFINDCLCFFACFACDFLLG